MEYHFGPLTVSADSPILAHIAPPIIKAIENYVNYGVTTDLIEAVASNDLREAVSRADDSNVRHMRELVQIFVNYCPFLCWGTPGVVRSWKKHGGFEGASHEKDSEG